MARGFWTGLGHGMVLSAALLAVLSLVVPMPEDMKQPVPEPAQGQAAPEDADSVSAGSSDAESRRMAPVDTPEAAAVDLPIGSEFGRGGDVAPRVPTPLAAPSAGSGPRDAPAVGAPAAEPAPVAVTGDNERPQTQDETGIAAPTAPQSGTDTPELTRPAALDAPVLNAAPGMAVTAGRDELPRSGFIFDNVPAADPRPQNPQDPADPDMAEAGETLQAPRLPSPGLDLSLPPDLTELRSLGRE
ncbi:hypothetical protein PAF17_18210 [Paracoccus sp. Z330]|uniref:Energy transducer TonB n=1 Tax=Paracoccus onchidii TaxID=3017813 RepID=A0ABT4ZJ82_9RHOB|nr:hypothetical protein [Paracoccus onchidii]MDB6179422.1 hypothetical protein [Paracoccus onchidii]